MPMILMGLNDFKSSVTRFEPIKPAAPVTRTVLFFKSIVGVNILNSYHTIILFYIITQSFFEIKIYRAERGIRSSLIKRVLLYL